jgi:tRNA pseudouridine55 synthase
MNFIQGEIIYINKPYRMSSFGALAFVRTRISKKVGVRRVKIGHAGTLDPLATGVLVLCTGKMTKEIERLQYDTKEYVATLQLGATTPSYDMEHEVDETYPVNHITEDGIRQVLAGFIGEIQQVPPQYSAVKIGGKRAYELKRKGNEVALASKPVRIDEIELTAYDAASKQATIRVVCGKGTYIRSLARDIGEAIQSGAYLTSLCRTRVGSVRIEECISIDDFSAWLDQQDIEMS